MSALSKDPGSEETKTPRAVFLVFEVRMPKRNQNNSVWEILDRAPARMSEGFCVTPRTLDPPTNDL